jgi:RNA polymerase sigma factor (sigma-70 family)
MNPHSESIPESSVETLRISQVTPTTFETLFSRYRRVLYFVSYRILNNHQDAEEAVQNCLLSASNKVPRFEHECNFRSWLLRVLIDDALAIVYKKRIKSTHSQERILDSLNPSPATNGEQCSSQSCIPRLTVPG